MNDVLTLIADDGTEREVFCEVRSIGQQEFYQSSASTYRPEKKFVLADHLDYNDEHLLHHDGQRYRVVRTYRAGQELEIVAERASAEEGGIYG